MARYTLHFTVELFDGDNEDDPEVLKQLGELMADMGERYLIAVDTTTFDRWEPATKAAAHLPSDGETDADWWENRGGPE